MEVSAGLQWYPLWHTELRLSSIVDVGATPIGLESTLASTTRARWSQLECGQGVDDHLSFE